MKTTHPIRLAPLAAALLAALALTACNKHNASTGADTTAANTPASTAPASTAPASTAPASTAPAAPAPDTGTAGTAANTSDNTAMADTSGMTAGTAMDNTAAGTTSGDMSASGAATPATTSADASAMAGAGAAASGPVTASQFYKEALTGGEKEIAEGRMAEKNGTTAVKDLAQMIVKDHQALDSKVKAAAGGAVSAGMADTSALTAKTGAEFDRAYVDALVTDHRKDIAAFENASKNASTDEAKKIARDALPTLRKHLAAAEKVQKTLK